MRIKPVLVVCLSSTLVSGCVPLFLGGVATAGYMSVQDRGAKAALIDTKIKTNIKERLTSTRYQYATEVGVNVVEGQVLLTGVVMNAKSAVEVEKIVRAVDGVESVYNELYTDGIYPAEQYTADTWILTQLRARLIGAQDVNATNYILSAVNGQVYIMGLTDSNSERERVMHMARTTKGVKRVKNYVKLIEVSKSTFLGLPLGTKTTSDNKYPQESLFGE